MNTGWALSPLMPVAPFFPPLTVIYIHVWAISQEPFLENKARIFLHFNTKGATDKIQAHTKAGLQWGFYWAAGSKLSFVFCPSLPGYPLKKCERISNKKEQKGRVSRPGLAPESPSEKKDKTQIRQLLHNATNCWWKTGEQSRQTSRGGLPL